MKFSAGHFTVFSQTSRERIHGHNFRVQASFTVEVSQNGLPADYKVFKNIVRGLCNELDEYFIIPVKSPYLKIEQKDNYTTIIHHESKFTFPTSDLKLLPIVNTTVEELASYLLSLVKDNVGLMSELNITLVEVGVSSGDGQIAFCNYTTSTPA